MEHNDDDDDDDDDDDVDQIFSHRLMLLFVLLCSLVLDLFFDYYVVFFCYVRLFSIRCSIIMLPFRAFCQAGGDWWGGEAALAGGGAVGS